MGLKSCNLLKTHLRYLLNLRTKFQPPVSISRGDIRGRNSKNRETNPGIRNGKFFYHSRSGLDFEFNAVPSYCSGRDFENYTIPVPFPEVFGLLFHLTFQLPVYFPFHYSFCSKFYHFHVYISKTT